MEHDPFASIPREIMEGLLQEMDVRHAHYLAHNPPHEIYRRTLKRNRDAIALVEAMENPTAEEWRIYEDLLQRVEQLEDEGEPLPPLPDARFSAPPPGIQ